MRTLMMVPVIATALSACAPVSTASQSPTPEVVGDDRIRHLEMRRCSGSYCFHGADGQLVLWTKQGPYPYVDAEKFGQRPRDFVFYSKAIQDKQTAYNQWVRDQHPYSIGFPARVYCQPNTLGRSASCNGRQLGVRVWAAGAFSVLEVPDSIGETGRLNAETLAVPFFQIGVRLRRAHADLASVLCPRGFRGPGPETDPAACSTDTHSYLRDTLASVTRDPVLAAATRELARAFHRSAALGKTLTDELERYPRPPSLDGFDPDDLTPGLVPRLQWAWIECEIHLVRAEQALRAYHALHP